MRIIDLLNKIANCEEVPEKIKYCDRIWTYFEEQADYTNDFERLFNYYINEEITTSLNDEVEIIEDKKIEKLNKQIDITKFANEYKEVAQCLTNFSNKINEIIDVINKGDK